MADAIIPLNPHRLAVDDLQDLVAVQRRDGLGQFLDLMVGEREFHNLTTDFADFMDGKRFIGKRERSKYIGLKQRVRRCQI